MVAAPVTIPHTGRAGRKSVLQATRAPHQEARVATGYTAGQGAVEAPLINVTVLTIL